MDSGLVGGRVGGWVDGQTFDAQLFTSMICLFDLIVIGDWLN